MLILWLLPSIAAAMASNPSINSSAAAAAVRHVHLNNAGDSPSPPPVTEAVIDHVRLEAEVGGYRAAELAQAKVQRVYESAARLVGAGIDQEEDEVGYDPRDEIALVESATVGWTRAFYSMLETRERELIARNRRRRRMDDHEEELVILVSEAEYAANIVACVKFARDRNTINSGSSLRWKVLPIPSSTIEGSKGARVSSGVVDLDAFRSMLDGTYALGNTGGQGCYLDPASVVVVCVTHIPTNSGTINHVNQIGDVIEEYNIRNEGGDDNRQRLPRILYLVDACQSVGQICVDVRKMKCHALAATGRKYLRGPRGTGFLYVKRSIAEVLEPSHIDHAAAPVASLPRLLTRGEKDVEGAVWTHGLEENGQFGLTYEYKPGAARFEFWESSIANKLGLGAAIDAALEVGMESIEERCASLGRLLTEGLAEMDGVRVFHEGSCECGIVTFSVDCLDAAAVKERMQSGIELEDGTCCFHLSVVPATSTPLDSSRTGLGDQSLLRTSVSYFNTEEEISLLCGALKGLMGEA